MIGSKHNWTKREVSFIRANWATMTNRELTNALGLTLTLVRTHCYEMGLKRMELEYWTANQVAFLKKNFKKYGDLELSEIFQRKWPKNKGWTLKHIEKKRMYLKLKRTKKDIRKIKDRAIKKGVYAESVKKMWITRGAAPDGEIRYWKQLKTGHDFPVIKVKGKWLHWAPYTYKKEIGKIPIGYKVTFLDRNNKNLDRKNLILVSDSEMCLRNTSVSSIGLSDNYIAGILSHGDVELRKVLKANPEFLNLKRHQLLLNRRIYEQESAA